MQVVGVISGETSEQVAQALAKVQAAIQARHGEDVTVLRPSGHIALFHTSDAKTLDTSVGSICLSGYATATEREVSEQVVQQLSGAPDAPVKISDSLGGTHSIVAATAENAVAWGSRPGCAIPYVLRLPGIVVVCSRPGVLKTAFNLPPDSNYMEWVAAVGYPLDDTSPYEGCKALLGGTAIRLRHGAAQIVPYELPPHGFLPKDKPRSQAALETVRKELMRAVNVVSAHPDAVFRLSGGKDSRLVASVLHAANLTCRVVTSGAQEREIARKVANIAGLPFEVAPPTREANANPNIADSALTALRATDGFIPLQGHKALNAREFLDDHPSATILGQIELTKGGYAKRKMHLKRRKAIAALENYVLTDVPKRRDELSKWMRDRFNYEQYQNPYDILFFPYAETRASRYLEVSYLRFSRHTMPVFPPNDERVFLALSNANRNQRASERLMYGLIEKNSPQMLTVPVFGDRWKFADDHSIEETPQAESDGSENPYHTPRALKFMRDYIQQSAAAWDIAQKSIAAPTLVHCGLIPGDPNTLPRMAKNKRLKVLMRLFLIAVALERWQSV